MNGTRRLLRMATLVVVAALVVLVGPAPAWARVDPPDVRGLSIPAAQQALQAWDKSVIITFVPALEQLPQGTDLSTVVASRRTWLNPVTIDPQPPQVEVILGTYVPDLRDLTRAQAVEALRTRGLRLAAEPAQAPDSWVVSAQRPAPGTLVEFRPPVTVALRAPVTPSATPAVTPAATPGPDPDPGGGLFTPELVLAVGGSGLGLGLLILVAALSLRRAGLRRAAPPPANNVEVRGYAGQVVGPELSEGGVSLSVRLEPHHDPGTLTLEEER